MTGLIVCGSAVLDPDDDGTSPAPWVQYHCPFPHIAIGPAPGTVCMVLPGDERVAAECGPGPNVGLARVVTVDVDDWQGDSPRLSARVNVTIDEPRIVEQVRAAALLGADVHAAVVSVAWDQPGACWRVSFPWGYPTGIVRQAEAAWRAYFAPQPTEQFASLRWSTRAGWGAVVLAVLTAAAPPDPEPVPTTEGP